MESPSIIKPVLILGGAVIMLAGMHFAASILVPILLGGFFATLLMPINNGLRRRRVPGGLALLLTAGFLVLVATFLALLIGRSLTTLETSLDSYSEQFAQQREELAAQLGATDETLSAADPVALTAVLGFILSAVSDLIKSAALILIVAMFVLAESAQFKKRLKRIYGKEHFLTKNLTTLSASMIGYFSLRALVNLVTATATGLMLWLLGIDHAGLWAVLTFFLSFVPYVGAFIAAIPPLLLGYAEGGIAMVALIGLLIVLINGISENLVAPMVMGKGLSISPTVVFLSFVFWMFILGGAGAFIAMPLTMAIILFLGSFKETAGLSGLLLSSSEPVPAAEGAMNPNPIQ